MKKKKNENKIKMKRETGKSEEEMGDEIGKREVSAGMRIRVSTELIGDQSEVKIDKRFTTTTTDKAAIIQGIIK